MNAPGLAGHADRSQRRSIVIVLLTAVVMATIPALWFARIAVADMTDDIKAGRLRLALLAATQADRVVVEAFYEIEIMAQGLTLGEHGALPADPAGSLYELHGRGGSFHTGVALLSPSGDLIASLPAGSFDLEETDILRTAARADDRAVSMPWFDEQTGHAIAALSVPLFSSEGTQAATLVGFMDLAEPLIGDLIVPAARLGPFGHADLVDERGIVLASTEPGHVLTAGDHPEFYRAAASLRRAHVDRAAHQRGRETSDDSEFHTMAYAPLQNAPWGVAMGADERETLHPVRRLQARLLVFAGASFVTLLLGVGLAARWIPRQERRDPTT